MVKRWMYYCRLVHQLRVKFNKIRIKRLHYHYHILCSCKTKFQAAHRSKALRHVCHTSNMWFHFLQSGVGMGESCHVMSSRLTRLFFNLTLFFPSADGVLSTFGRNIQHWLEEFPTYSVEHHFEFARVWKLIILLHLSLFSSLYP